MPVLRFPLMISFLLWSASIAQTSQPTENDAFIAGYAASVVQQELGYNVDTLRVSDGIIYFDVQNLGPREVQQLRDALANVPGVNDVRFRVGESTWTVVDDRGSLQAGTPAEPEGPTIDAAGRVKPDRQFYLAPARLFDPIKADPHWPHFYATYNYREKDNNLVRHEGSVGFGEAIGVYQRQLGATRLEFGVHAGLFATFDLDSDSSNLVNADYFIAPALSVRSGRFSSLLRVGHQSSHLGDETLIENPTLTRVNYSFEFVDAIASFEPNRVFRLYGGGRYIIRIEPQEHDRLTAQYGVELTSPWAFANGRLRPVAMVDLQHREERDWNADISARLGLSLEDENRLGRRLMLLAEYYDGTNYNGQFYTEDQRTFGVGLHFFF